MKRGSVVIASLPRKIPGQSDRHQVRIGILHDDEEEDGGKKHPFIMDWDNPYRRAWDIMVVMAVIYMCFTVPLTVAFIDMAFPSTLGTFLDVLFWVDIVLNFRTGIIEHGAHVKDPKKIAEHYLQTWFFIDICASIPFEYILDASFDKSARKSLKILKWLKIPKLLRVGRIFKYLKSWVVYYRVVTLSLMMGLWMHLVGCIWLAVTEPCDILALEEAGLATQLSKANCTQPEMWGFYGLSLRMSFLMIFQVSDPFAFTAHIDRAVYDDWLLMAQKQGLVAGGDGGNSTLRRALDEEGAGAGEGTGSWAGARAAAAAAAAPAAAAAAARELGSIAAEPPATLATFSQLPRFGYADNAWSAWRLGDTRHSQSVYLMFVTIVGMTFGLWITTNFVAEAVMFAVNRMHTFNKYYNKVHRFEEEMELLRIPLKTQYRVRRYYDYLYINRKMGLNDHGRGSILKDSDLSLPLRKELALHVHGRLLGQLSLFKDCSEDCLFAVALRLKTHVYLPGDAIFRKGDVARELFFIRKGLIAVAFGEIDAFKPNKEDGSKDTSLEKSPLQSQQRRDIDKDDESEFKMDKTLEDSSTVKIMGPGAFFGEIALLTSMPRSCSVFSKTVSELNELSKSDFEEVMLDYPELSKEVAEQVMTMYPGLREKIEKFLTQHVNSPGAGPGGAASGLGDAGSSNSTSGGGGDRDGHGPSASSATKHLHESLQMRSAASVRQTQERTVDKEAAGHHSRWGGLPGLLKAQDNKLLMVPMFEANAVRIEATLKRHLDLAVDKILDAIQRGNRDDGQGDDDRGAGRARLAPPVASSPQPAAYSPQRAPVKNPSAIRSHAVSKARDSMILGVDDLLETLSMENKSHEL